MSEMTQAELAALAAEVYTPNYRPAPIVFERGEGAWLYDGEGARYLDFTAGIAVCALGHGHPALTRALSEQAARALTARARLLARLPRLNGEQLRHAALKPPRADGRQRLAEQRLGGGSAARDQRPQKHAT